MLYIAAVYFKCCPIYQQWLIATVRKTLCIIIYHLAQRVDHPKYMVAIEKKS